MSHFYLLIISLFIISSHGNFIKFKEGMEYNLLIKEHDMRTSHPKGIIKENESSEVYLQLKAISNEKFICQFYNQETSNEDEKYFDEPFILQMNESKINNFTFPRNITNEEYEGIERVMKSVVKDRSSITKLLEREVWKNETTIVNNVPFGDCESNITIIQDSETVTIKADSVKIFCTFTDEIKRLWGPEFLGLMNDSSEYFDIITFEGTDMNPTKLESYMALKMITADGFDVYTIKMTLELVNSKEIKIEEEINGDWMAMTNEEIIETIKVTTKKTIN